MRTRTTIRTGVLVATLAASSAVGLLTGTSAQAAAPSWQTTGADPDRAGTLSFYDAGGTQVYGGRTDQPFGYVVGSSVVPAGDTSATLFLHRPTDGAAPGAWSGSQLTAATAFPATPTGVPTGHPVVRGSAADGTVAGFEGAYPSNDGAAGYSGVYELRLRTTGPGHVSTSYDVADIKVTGSTWSLVYPVVSTPTSTSLSATPAGVKAGGSVTLTATVTPGSATGVVQFYDGTTALGTPVTVSSGVASASVTLAKAGARTLRADFAPTGTSQNEASSATTTYIVAKATPTITGTWSTTKPVYGRSYTVKAKVAGAGLTPTGTVRVLFGKTVLVSRTLSSGAATLTVPGAAVAPGKRTLTLAYLGSADVSAVSTTKAVTIAKASSRTTNSVAPKRIAKTKAAKLTVSVTATGVVPTGAITVYDGSKKIRTVTLKAAAKGKIVITLPKLKAGKHSLHAVYAGSSTVAASKAAAVALTVTR